MYTSLFSFVSRSMSLSTHEYVSRCTYIFFFPEQLEKKKTDEVYDESTFSLYLFFTAIMCHMAPYNKEKRPDATEHSKLPEVFMDDKLIGFKLLTGHVLGSSLPQ